MTSIVNRTSQSESDRINAFEKVTTDKQTNPGRQDWGRKLGKMQKELKAKTLSGQAITGDIEPAKHAEPSFLIWEYGVSVAGLAIGFAALYYQKK